MTLWDIQVNTDHHTLEVNGDNVVFLIHATILWCERMALSQAWSKVSAEEGYMIQ